MNMSVEDELAGGGAVVHADIDAFRAYSQDCVGNLFCYYRDLGENIVGRIVDILKMSFRNHKRMSRVHWFDIKKSENGIVLINLSGRDFSCDNFAENTASHICVV